MRRKDFFSIQYASLRAAVQPESTLAAQHVFLYTQIAGLGTFKQVGARPIGSKIESEVIDMIGRV